MSYLTSYTSKQTDYPRICSYNAIYIEPEVSVTASVEDAGYPDIHLTTPSMAEVWRGDISAGEEIEVNHSGSGFSADCMAIAGHNLHEIGATVSVKVQQGGTGSWADASTALEITDGSPIVFEILRTSTEYRFVFTVVGTPTESAEIAILYVGDMITLPQKIYEGHTPAVFARTDKAISHKSENGKYLGRVVTSTHTSSKASFQHIPAASLRDFKYKNFVKYGGQYPFFFVWRPDSYPDETEFCWLNGGIDISNQMSNGLMQMSFKYSAAHYE